MSKFNVCVSYTAKNTGDRELFVAELKKSGALDDILAEDGCLRYEYFYSDENPKSLLLMETWETPEHQRAHMKTPHMKTVFEIKDKYIESATVSVFEVK